jgi:hypothetical protein
MKTLLLLTLLTSCKYTFTKDKRYVIFIKDKQYTCKYVHSTKVYRDCGSVNDEKIKEIRFTSGYVLEIENRRTE